MTEELTVQEQFEAALTALPPKRRKFVHEYLHDFHQRNAAVRAGYSEKTADVQASQLLRNVNVRTAVDLGFQLAAMPAPEVVARLSDMARGSADDLVTIYESPLHDTTGQPVRDKDDQPIVRHFPSLDLEKARQRGVLHLVKKVAYTAHGPSVELYDAQAALALLAKYHGLLVDRAELTGKDGVPLFPDFEQALKKAYADDATTTDTA